MKSQILVASKLKMTMPNQTQAAEIIYAQSNKGIINQIKTNPKISTIIIDIKNFKSLLKSQYQDLNPLTLLPGNKTIKKVIKKKLNNFIAILYIDLDNFKNYNDTYGFNNGDKIIKKIAKILKNKIKKYGNKNDFLGHIGGDDFFIVSTIDHAENLAQKICNFLNKKNNFSVRSACASKPCRSREPIQKSTRTPLTLSIAIITNENNNLTSVAQVSKIAAQIKTYAKTKHDCIGKSNYVINYKIERFNHE
ncbi:MAG: diguanylate cyclase [Candidatus Babeliales bacterium]